MRVISHSSVAGVIISVLVMVSSAIPTATGSGDQGAVKPNQEAAALSDETNVDLVQTTQYFDHAVSLADAVALSDRGRLNAVAYRVENDSVVSEYWPDDTLPPSSYTKWFREQYGTDPEVVGVIKMVEPIELATSPSPSLLEEIERQSEATGSGSQGAEIEAGPGTTNPDGPPESDVPPEAPSLPVITVKEPEFSAPAPSGEGAASEFFTPETDSVSTTAMTTAFASNARLALEANADPTLVADIDASTVSDIRIDSSNNWFPRDVEVRIERVSGRQYFYTFANWKSGTSAASRPQKNIYDGTKVYTVDYGMEFEVNLYNNAGPGLRPVTCAAGYEDAFIAKNNGFTWGVTMGTSSVALTTSAYADTNDVADSCNKNSMAVGLARPWNLPRNAQGFHQVLVSINAPLGNSSSSRVGSVVQLVDNMSCQMYPNSALTDCMGDSLITAPGERSRLSLNEVKRWTAAPSLCYFSGSFGGSVARSIPRGDGCYHG